MPTRTSGPSSPSRSSARRPGRAPSGMLPGGVPARVNATVADNTHAGRGLSGRSPERLARQVPATGPPKLSRVGIIVWCPYHRMLPVPRSSRSARGTGGTMLPFRRGRPGTRLASPPSRRHGPGEDAHDHRVLPAPVGGSHDRSVPGVPAHQLGTGDRQVRARHPGPAPPRRRPRPERPPGRCPRTSHRALGCRRGAPPVGCRRLPFVPLPAATRWRAVARQGLFGRTGRAGEA